MKQFNPFYGPGNEDYEYDGERQRQDEEERRQQEDETHPPQGAHQ